MGPSTKSGKMLQLSHWTAENHSSDVRRWEVCGNGGVSEGPWSFRRPVLQAIATMSGGVCSCPSYLRRDASRICNTNTSNISTSVLGHGAPSTRIRSTVIVPYLQKDIKLNERMQRLATRYVKTFRRLSYPERLHELKLPSME